MKTAIFITVRTGSKRLPNKALLEIQSIPTIVHLIRRMKKVQVDHIVLCTTLLKEDDILCDIASKEGIVFFRGSTKDKLDRWKGAAAKFGIDFFKRIFISLVFLIEDFQILLTWIRGSNIF